LSHKHVYSRQNIDQADVDAVIEVLGSDYLTQGPIVEQFEADIAAYTGSRHAVAVNSATSALHLTMLANGINANDVVWTTPNTFVATANAARMCGASVGFIDIDPMTLNLSPQALETALQAAAKTHTLPEAIVFVHFAGNPTGLAEIVDIANSFGIPVIEDGSHALGSSISNVPVGSCKLSQATVFSFHAVKPITAGEGGVITTNDDQFAKKLKLLRSHGITRDTHLFENCHAANVMPKWYYEQIELGFNYRMSDIHAALGRSQLKKVDVLAKQRRDLASLYEQQFSDTNIELQSHHPNVQSARHIFVIKCPSRDMREKIENRFAESGIGYNFHYIPVYRHPYYASQAHQSCLQMEDYFNRGLTLPLHTFLDATDVETIAEIVNSITQQQS